MLRRRKNQNSANPPADEAKAVLPDPEGFDVARNAAASKPESEIESLDVINDAVSPKSQQESAGASGADGPIDAATRPAQRTESRYRREDERRREEARSATIQSQVDELRQLLREIASRQLRIDEQTKHQQALVAQNTLAIEQAQKDAAQNADARALDENRTRQKIDDLESRIDDGIRPIRSLQAHVTEMLEESRKKADDTAKYDQQIEQLTAMIEHLSSLGDRTSAVSHGLRDGIEAVRGELDGLRRDVIRSEDAVKIVDQEARRRTADVQEVVDSYNIRMDELRSDLAHLFDSLENTRRGLVHVDPSLDELRTASETLQHDFARLQTLSEERHDMAIDMHDDARQETDARFEQIRQNTEERVDRLNERLEETNESLRELSYRIGSVNSDLEELRQTDAALHRDIWYLHEQRIRIRMEQIQEELDSATTQRREAEAELKQSSGPRSRRRRSDVESDI